MERERLKILEMVAERKITPQQAAELLKAVEQPEVTEEASGRKPKWLRVAVTELDSGDSKVNVRVPFMLARWGLKMGGKAAIKHGEHDLDLAELARAIEEGAGEGSTLVDVEDRDKGEHVRVWVE